MRLLISARDTGAAAHIAEIAPALRTAGSVEVVLVADEPALSLLKRCGLSPLPFTAHAIADKDSPGTDALRNAARQLIAAHRPDALLVGLSGPGIGLDEALVAEADGLPCYAVQDYPGWVVDGFGVKPDTYFVTDKLAADMTLKRLDGGKTVVIGSAKHAAYARLDPLALRQAGRARLGSNGPHIGFYGQPAWFLPGYVRAVTSFARAVADMRGADLFYRPHPKETADERARMAAILAAAGLKPRFDPNDAVEQSICAADLVVTCFSSCGADHIHLQKRSPEPLGTVLYLFTEPDIQAHHARHAGSDVPPFALLELAALTTAPDKLAADLRHALDPATSSAYWRQTRQVLPDPVAAPDVILATIRQDLKPAAMLTGIKDAT